MLAYVREYKGQEVLVALNMSGNPQTVRFDIGQTANTLLSSEKKAPKRVTLAALKLAPFESFVGEVK